MAATNNLSAKDLPDMIKDIAGDIIAERVKEAMSNGRQAARENNVDLIKETKSFQGIDHDARTRNKLEQNGMAGQFIRAAAKAYNDDGHSFDAGRFGHALKTLGRVPEIEKMYKAHIEKHLVKTGRTKALAETVFVDGGAVVPPAFVEEIIEFLRSKVVVRALGARVAPMPRGTMTFPYAATGTTASTTTENTVTNISQPSFGQFQLVAKKLRAIVPISNDLLHDASPEADLFVQQDMVAALRVLEDFNMLRGSGNSGQMKGLRNLAQNSLIAHNAAGTAGGSTVSEIVQDIVSCIVAIQNNNVTIEKGGWVLAPRTAMALMALRDGVGSFLFKAEMLTGKLWGYDYGTTTTQPINLNTNSGLSGKESEVLFADFDRVIIGDTQELTIVPYLGGAYYDSNAGAMVSGISNDQTVVVGQLRSDINARYRGAEITNLTQVTWGA